jgi:preprotein translocase subunit SecG
VSFLTALLMTLLVICSLFLICLVLIQRGKGGGLAGAFGGVGGSSAFGTKAGDVFTRVTIITAIVWFLLNMALVVLTSQRQGSAFAIAGSSGKEVPISAETGKGKGKTTAPTSPSRPASSAPASSSAPKETESLLPPVFDEDMPAAKPAEKRAPGKKSP